MTGAWNPEADRLEQAAPLYRSLGAAIARVAAASRARVANMFAAFNPRERPCPEGSALRAHLLLLEGATRIRPTPGTARWPTRTWPRRATRGSHRRFCGPIGLTRRATDRPPAGWPIRLGHRWSSPGRSPEESGRWIRVVTGVVAVAARFAGARRGCEVVGVPPCRFYARLVGALQEGEETSSGIGAAPASVGHSRSSSVATGSRNTVL